MSAAAARPAVVPPPDACLATCPLSAPFAAEQEKVKHLEDAVRRIEDAISHMQWATIGALGSLSLGLLVLLFKLVLR